MLAHRLRRPHSIKQTLGVGLHLVFAGLLQIRLHLSMLIVFVMFNVVCWSIFQSLEAARTKPSPNSNQQIVILD